MSKDKVVIGKSVLNEEPVKKFIEHMKSQGYIVDTTEYGVETVGEG